MAAQARDVYWRDRSDERLHVYARKPPERGPEPGGFRDSGGRYERQPQRVFDRRGDARHAGRLSDARYRFHYRGERDQGSAGGSEENAARKFCPKTRTASWRIWCFRAASMPPLGMARQEKYAKPGAKPSVKPATIHEDLRGRDFTINSIALSLNPASRGLLLDPNNGVGDLERKELRAVSNYTLYDDPDPPDAAAALQGAAGFHHRRAHQDAVRQCARGATGNAHRARGSAGRIAPHRQRTQLRRHYPVAGRREAAAACSRRIWPASS